MRKEASAMKAVKEWNEFMYCFPCGFIHDCWNDNPNLADHFQNKFDRLIQDGKNSSGVVLDFCAELATSNYERLIEYVLSGKWRNCEYK